MRSVVNNVHDKFGGTDPSFKALGKYDNGGESFLPNHPPKVIQGVRKRTYNQQHNNHIIMRLVDH